MTAVRDVEDCYRVTHVDAPEDAPASSKDNSPLWRAVAQAQHEAEERLDREAGTSRGRIALIVGNERARAWGADVDGETALSERVSLLSAVASKGLEFDSVILVEPGGDPQRRRRRPFRRPHPRHPRRARRPLRSPARRHGRVVGATTR